MKAFFIGMIQFSKTILETTMGLNAGISRVVTGRRSGY